MWFRFLALGILIFWGIMTSLLIRAVYFPEFERLPKVDPEHVLELFIDNREVAQLYIFKGTEVVGDIMMTPRHLPGTGGAEIGFAAAGVVELPNLPRQKLNWRGKLHLGPLPKRRLTAIDIGVRFSDPAVSVLLHIDPVSMDFYYTVMQGGVVVSDSVSEGGVVVSDSRTDPSAVGVAQMQLMMAAWGIEFGGREEGERAKLEARQGAIEIAGHRAGAYFMRLGIPGAGEVNLTFSEAGELLELFTPLGYEILAEAMRAPPDPLPYNE